jgi:uncharacterized membrane protein HdeD (DUF308 family)
MSATSRIWTTPHVSVTWLAVRGIAAILFGILALVWPGLTILALAILFGAYALVNGIFMVIDAFRGHRTGAQRAAYAVAGGLGVAAGLVTLLWPHITVLALVVLVGLWAVVTGIFDIVAATRIPGSWPLILLGLLSVAAGILVLFRPAAGAYAIALVIGIYAIVGGGLMLAELWRNRHARPTGHDRTAPAGA